MGILLTLGPNLALKAALIYARAAFGKAGLLLSYEKAGAAFFFDSAEISGIHLSKEGKETLSLSLLRLEKPSLLNIISLSSKEADMGKALKAAKGVFLKNLKADFTSFGGKDYYPGGSLKLGRLKAGRHGEKLDLDLEDLFFSGGAQPNAPSLSAKALTAGGVDIAALSRILAGGENSIILTLCENLDLTEGVISISGREYLGLSRALFNVERRADGSSRHSRSLDLKLNLLELAALDEALGREPAFMALTDVSGGSLPLKLNIDLLYQPEGGSLSFQELSLKSPALGLLRAEGRIEGLSEIKPGFTPYQLLFAAAGGSLKAFSLSFSDQGFMPAFYKALDSTVFASLPKGQSAENLMKFHVGPLAEDLFGENALENIPALSDEIRAFLKAPESFTIKCAPAGPLPLLSLANLNKYDIIERLNLTIQVSQRDPLPLMAPQGVSLERLPSAPRPLEKSFSEENI